MTEGSTTTVEVPPSASDNGIHPGEGGQYTPPVDFGPRARRWPALLLGIAVGVGATAAVATFLERRDDGADTDGAVVALATATVEQRDLIEEIEWSGTLGYGQPVSLSGTGGTVTDAAPVGAVIERGDVLLEVDGQPVIAFFGPTPMWRSMSEGDTGTDVLQLETNLAALGFDPYQTVDIDNTFTANTETMVERWQEEIGVEPTGTVAFGSVVMIEGPSIVSSAPEIGSSGAGPLAVVAPRAAVVDVVATVDGVIDQVAPVGTTVAPGTVLYHVDGVPVVAITEPGALENDEPSEDDPEYTSLLPAGLVVIDQLVADGENVVDGGPVLTLSVSRLAVEIIVDVADADEFMVDQEVTIELADETTTTGSVTAIGPVVQSTDPQGSPTVTVEVAVTADSSTELVEGTVSVISAGETITAATVVPTRALISLAEGGFAVEKAASDGSTTLVGIEIGSFDDGVVEVVAGDLAPGDEVVVPQ